MINRIRRAVLIANIALLFALTAFAAPALITSAQDDALAEDFSGELAYQHVADHVNAGFRRTATLGNYAAGNLILEKLESYGWETSEDWHVVNLGDVSTYSDEELRALEDWQPFSVQDALVGQISEAGETADSWRDVEIGELLVPVRNLVATYGSPENGVIIIGAHYDSRLFSDKDPVVENRFLPMPGANDGGSGVGVLLELARVLSQSYTPNMQIRLVFFDAEDNGRIPPWTRAQPSVNGYLVGSSLYAQNLDLASDPIALMLLVDLVGEFDQRFPQEGYSVSYAQQYTNAIWSIAHELGYGEQFPMEARGSITDDHVPFLQRGIPAVDIIDLEYEFWDTSLDTLDRISADSLERVGRVLQVFLERSGLVTRVTG